MMCDAVFLPWRDVVPFKATAFVSEGTIIVFNKENVDDPDLVGKCGYVIHSTLEGKTGFAKIQGLLRFRGTEADRWKENMVCHWDPNFRVVTSNADYPVLGTVRGTAVDEYQDLVDVEIGVTR